MDNNRNNRPPIQDEQPKKTPSSSMMGVAAIIAVGIFVLCVIFILAKGLFATNNSKVPDGLYTGTTFSQTTTTAQTTKKPDETKDDSKPDDSSVDSAVDSSVDSSDVDSDSDSSMAEVSGDVMYVTESAYVRSGPSSDDEPILTISAGYAVNVLESGDYCKISFDDGSGTIVTGYIHSSYLSSSN